MRLFSSILLFLSLSGLIHAQQIPGEEAAFTAVRRATNPAARLAAAEDFVANFPHSTKRPEVARLVSEYLPIIRNSEIAVSMVVRARAIFTSPEELEFFKPVALEIYANGYRANEAFTLAGELLSKQPDDIWSLIKLTNLGAHEAKNSNLKYADQSLQYGFKAIELIEKDLKPPRLTDSSWLEAKSKLGGLYQQVGIISLAVSKVSEAKTYLAKAIKLSPRDPTSYALLGRVLNGEYEKVKATYSEMPEGNAKADEKKRLDIALDEIIDAYAHAVGLATGKEEHQTLLQQLVPDLTTFYKYRHGSVEGLQKLVAKYR
jgi:tetratricopeptide (TPR) repeat protein